MATFLAAVLREHVGIDQIRLGPPEYVFFKTGVAANSDLDRICMRHFGPIQSHQVQDRAVVCERDRAGGSYAQHGAGGRSCSRTPECLTASHDREVEVHLFAGLMVTYEENPIV